MAYYIMIEYFVLKLYKRARDISEKYYYKKKLPKIAAKILYYTILDPIKLEGVGVMKKAFTPIHLTHIHTQDSCNTLMYRVLFK